MQLVFTGRFTSGFSQCFELIDIGDNVFDIVGVDIFPFDDVGQRVAYGIGPAPLFGVDFAMLTAA
jgi:hypothetical protein